jgi:hypothetical protein
MAPDFSVAWQCLSKRTISLEELTEVPTPGSNYQIRLASQEVKITCQDLITRFFTFDGYTDGRAVATRFPGKVLQSKCHVISMNRARVARFILIQQSKTGKIYQMTIK